MSQEELKRDFDKFLQSRYYGNLSGMRDVINKATKLPISGGGGGYISPTIMEERELNVTQMDVFSRLMMDRTIFFGTEVSDYTANVAIAQMLYLDSQGNEPIKFFVNSPGGSVYAGYGILDTMNFIKSTVETTCTGLAASMGAMILMCGARGKRSMLKHARCMIHQPLSGVEGQATDIEITAKEILKLKDELYEIIAQRSGQSMEKIRLDCERDHWLTAEETKAYGIIDNVIEPVWD